MAHIFASHSQRDKDIVHFFLEAFAGTNVKPHFEEFEAMPLGGLGADKITTDIQSANALFVLLTESVAQLSHTRDWVNWECGTALNKEIWVFEPLESLGRINVVVPRVSHYVVFGQTPEWRDYLRAVIQSYDDSHVIPTLSAAAGGGALFNPKDPGTGAAVGFAVGLGLLALKNAAKPMLGTGVKCWKCPSIYRLHLPKAQESQFRCPVCNAHSVFNAVPIAPVEAPSLEYIS